VVVLNETYDRLEAGGPPDNRQTRPKTTARSGVPPAGASIPQITPLMGQDYRFKTWSLT